MVNHQEICEFKKKNQFLIRKAQDYLVVKYHQEVVQDYMPAEMEKKEVIYKCISRQNNDQIFYIKI